jgi:AcrR family transcriptional regulator
VEEVAPLSPQARHLVDVALELFARRGYDATSVNDIVAAAKVTKGAFYHYFTSKDDLLRLLHEEYIDGELAALREIRAADLPPAEALTRVIEHILVGLPEHQRSMGVFLRDRRSLSDESFTALKAKRDEWDEMFTDIIESGIASGHFAPAGDARIIGFGVVGMCVWAQEWFDPEGRSSPEAIARAYAALVLDGLRPRA